MTNVMSDVRYAVRLFMKNPGFTAVAVLTLTLGIGANSATFSVVNAVLLRPLPFQNPDELVMVWERNFPRNRTTNVVSPANFLSWRDDSRSFVGLAALVQNRQNLTGMGEPEELAAQWVTANLLSVLGVPAALGRTFAPEDDQPGAEPVVLLSHRLWQRRFGGEPTVVGRSITLSNRPYVVIGVMPPDFVVLDHGVDVWRPLIFGAEARTPGGRSLRVVARLAPAVTRDQAQAEMDVVAARLTETFPDFNAGWGVTVVPLHEQTVGSVRPALLVLLGSVGFVLLIACANVANLLLGRAVTRRRELAVRSALGAGRRRLIRQLLTESLVLSGVAGLLGLAFAAWALRSLLGAVANHVPLPRVDEIALDGPVAAFTLIASITTGVVFGLIPALTSTHVTLADSLKQDGRASSEGVGSRRLRGALVVAEVALALMLLIAASLMLRSFQRLISVDPGFNADQVLTMRVTLPASKYPEYHQRIAFYEQAIEQLEQLPGVLSAGANAFLPFDGPGSATSFMVDGRPEPAAGEKPVTDVRVISGDYFKAMGLPLLRGRLFAGEDGAEGHRVVIVNQTMVDRMFPDEDPIGKRLAVSWDEGVIDEIVGVVGDIKHQGLDTQPRGMIYWPHRRVQFPFMTLVVRTSGDPLSAAQAVRDVIRSMDPEQPVAEVRTMAAVVSSSAAQPRLTTSLLTVFGGLAALLAAIGIYGVLSYSVSQRTHEFGIRLAVGAAPTRLLALVMGQSLVIVLSGMALGLVGALALSRLLRSLLFEVSPTDPVTFVAVPLALGCVALVASYVPARRATQVDPVVALRAE